MNKIAGLLRVSLCLMAAMAASSCAHFQKQIGAFDVSLPSIKLEQDELVQRVVFDIHGAFVQSIRPIQRDWDYRMDWDHPGLLRFECLARHFSSGRLDLSDFRNLFTVIPSGESRTAITAIVSTQSAEPTGRAPREIVLSKDQILFRRASSCRPPRRP